MADYAELDENNVVLNIIVVSEEDETKGIEFCKNLLGGKWIKTTEGVRKQKAFIGGKYDEKADVFIQPQPFKSWILNSNHDWVSPKIKPKDDNRYYWDEDSLDWKIMEKGK